MLRHLTEPIWVTWRAWEVNWCIGKTISKTRPRQLCSATYFIAHRHTSSPEVRQKANELQMSTGLERQVRGQPLHPSVTLPMQISDNLLLYLLTTQEHHKSIATTGAVRRLL